MIDAIFQFQDAIRATGLEPPDVIEIGRLHRFPGIGKRQSNRAGWCKMFDDGRGGSFGDWSSGFSENWQAKRDKPFSRSDRAAFMRRVTEAREQSEKERIAKQEVAENRANAIWKSAPVAPSNHSYLIFKSIKAHGARLHKGALVLPVVDFTGKLTSLQFISPDGGKLLLSGGRKRGCVIPVAYSHNTRTAEQPADLLDSADIAYCAYRGPKRRRSLRVVVCEGWATGGTLAEDDPETLVLAAIDAGNLEPVAVAARHRWPFAELVVAGDDDRLTTGNPGATKARAAAIVANALLALPQWPADAPEGLTDFNDLAVWLAGRAA